MGWVLIATEAIKKRSLLCEFVGILDVMKVKPEAPDDEEVFHVGEPYHKR